MIVGNGLLASKCDIQAEDVIVFASGVSNSNETREREYNREVDLLLKQDRDKKLVYFSTCSIYDSHYRGEDYIGHKLNMETIIEKEFPFHCIVRLPNVVSNSSNPNTLFNYLRSSTQSGKRVKIFKNSFRYLVDVDDVKGYVMRCLEKSGAYNLILDRPIEVKELAILMGECLCEDYELDIVPSEDTLYEVDGDFETIKGYNQMVVEKYCRSSNG
jgi:nucleoside-diphosphate-sugar epimerase